MSVLSINTSFNIQLDFECAPFGKRLLAFIIDQLILIVYYFAIVWMTGLNLIDDLGEDTSMLWYYILSIPALLYHLIFEILLKGESPGKKIAGIRVISNDGNEASWSQYVIRWILRPFDFLLSSFLGSIISVSTTPYNQRLGDLAAGTLVVNKKLPYTIDKTIFKHINENEHVVRYPAVMRLSDRDINTINNVLNNANKSNNISYVNTIAQKIKLALKIESSSDDYTFLHELLEDYNYLSNRN